MENPEKNDKDVTYEEVMEASAGEARSLPDQPLMAALAAKPEPSTADLIARQAEKGETRKSGPPLPEGDPSSGAPLADTVDDDEDAPTDTAAPRPQDC